MVKNCIKKTLFWNRFRHSSDLVSFFSEHCHPLGLGYVKTPLISEHCHPKSKCINLFIFLFRSIATHYIPAIVFRSIATHYRLAIAFRSIATHYRPAIAFRSIAAQLFSCLFYFSALALINNNLMHNYMAGKITEMSRIKQVLQLHENGVSNRSIALQLGLYKQTVNKYIQQYKALSISVQELLQKDTPELERLFNGGTPAYVDKRFDDLSKRLPYLEKELGRKHVTRLRLWEEYIAEYPSGYSFTQFCFHLNQHAIAKTPSTVLVNSYVAAEKCYVDFAGDTMSYTDMDTGEVVKVQTFVGCLPYTDYAFAICVPSQKSEDFIYAITQMFAFFGGVTRIVVPDNLKSAVTKSDRYEPEINRLMEHLGNHYGFVVLPTRPGKPKDKGLVENQVKLVYQRVYAPLRKRHFFSLGDMNKAVLEQIQLHNHKRMQQRPYSREEHFVSDEKMFLKPLPETCFEVQYDTELTVSANCCVYLGRDKHYYSVPYQHIGQKVKVIYTRTLVKVYLKGERIATHPRVEGFGYSMLEEHTASHSNAYNRRSVAYYTQTAGEKSAVLKELFTLMFSSKEVPPEFFYKRCDGLLRLQRITPPEQMEKACQIAIEHGQYTYKFVERVLHNLQAFILEEKTMKMNPEPDNHENIRGSGYYQ